VRVLPQSRLGSPVLGSTNVTVEFFTTRAELRHRWGTVRRLDHIERTGVGIACWTKWAHGEGDNEYNVFTAAVLHLLPHPPRVLSAPMQELRP
jgi:hypothetical protein